MESNTVSPPIRLCEPRCLVLNEAVNQSQALNAANTRKNKTFGLKRFFTKVQADVDLLQRRLVPFWHVRCKSHFDYDQSSHYTITASSNDVVEITIQGSDGNTLNFPVDPTGKSNQVILHGIERCTSKHDVSQFIDAYESDHQTSLSDKAASFLHDEQKRMGKYLSQRSQVVTDLAAFYESAKLGTSPLYDDDLETIVVPPSQVANAVTSTVMKQVMVSIEAIKIHEWLLSVEFADLYFRPVYIFQFERKESDGSVVERKYEELDALSNTWTTLATSDIPETTITWDNVLRLSTDASDVVLKELGGVWKK